MGSRFGKHRVDININDEETSMTSQHDEFMPPNNARRFWWLYALAIGVPLAFAITAFAQAANTATITFGASTQYTDGTAYPSNAVVSYSLWQGLKGTPRVKVGSVTSGGSITTGLLTGNEYCWDVTTVVSIAGVATESAHSLAACKAFNGTPGVVTITVT